MIKLFCIANIRFPTERAHGIQVAHMCVAFAHSGAVVTLLVPDRKTLSIDPFDYYGVERTFTIEKIPVPDTVWLGTLGFLLESLVFAYRAAKRVRAEPDAIIYTREELPLRFLPVGSAFFEAHQIREGSAASQLIRRARGVIAISKGVAEAVTRLGIPREKILIAHDGYDPKQFEVSVTKEEARRRLGLPVEGKVAMYIGGLENWKGSQTLLSASGALARNGVPVVIIGGSESKVKTLRAKFPHANFLGNRPYKDLAINQRAADVLVIPNSAKERISRDFTSPLKLFAHMASGVPIVASDLSSLREVVGEREVVFFEPNNPDSLATAIQEILSDPTRAADRAHQARNRATDFTWERRAQTALDFMSG